MTAKKKSAAALFNMRRAAHHSVSGVNKWNHMGKRKGKKKSGNKDVAALRVIVFITAILNLIDAVLDLLERID